MPLFANKNIFLSHNWEYYETSLKNLILIGGTGGGGSSQKKETISRGDSLKKGLGELPDLREGLAKKKGWCFWGGWYPNPQYGYKK